MRFCKVQRTDEGGDDAGANRLGTIRLWIEAVPGVRAARRLDWALVVFDDEVTLRTIDSNRLVTRVAATPAELRLQQALAKRGRSMDEFGPTARNHFHCKVLLTDAEALALGVS
jgi:hypothetical protein